MSSTWAVVSLAGVTAHGNPVGPLQFDRLEVIPTARRPTAASRWVVCN